MSSKKVDQYKEYKKNKKKILKSEKRKNTAAKMCAWLIVLAAVAVVAYFVGSAVVKAYQDYLESRPDYTSTSFMLGDQAGIRDKETEEDTTEAVTEAATTAEAQTEEVTEQAGTTEEGGTEAAPTDEPEAAPSDEPVEDAPTDEPEAEETQAQAE